MSSKPTFVLVPGAWHRTGYFAQIRAYLSDNGYPSVGVETPTVGSDPPASTMDVDTDAVEVAVRKVLDCGEDVVLLMHSYGGGPGSEAAGRIAEEALKGGGGPVDGKKGRIKRLVYVAAFVPIEGQPMGSPASVVPGFVPEYMDILEVRWGWFIITTSDPSDEAYLANGVFGDALWEVIANNAPAKDGNTKCNEKALDWMYAGLPGEEQQKHLEATSTHPLATFLEPHKRVGWRYIPSTSVYAVKDKPLPLQFVEFMVKRAQKEEARPGGVQAFTGELGEVFMDCGHCAMFLVPDKVEELGKILVAAAEES